MPELPEVETVRRGLAPTMEGARLRRLELRRPDLRFPLPRDFAARVEGRRIEALSRRAKYLLIDLEDDLTVIAHLGMSGRMTLHDAASAKGTTKLQQQQAVAERFAQQLELSDVDSRVLITSALRALQSIGRLSKNFAALETLTRGLLVELQQSVFVGRAGASVLSLKHTPSATTSVGSVYSMQVLRKDANALSELKSFLVAASSGASQVSQAPFAAVSVVLKKLRGASSQLLFGLCLEAPEKMLGSFAQEDVWGATSAPGADRDQLRENMLPQSVVTQVWLVRVLFFAENVTVCFS